MSRFFERSENTRWNNDHPYTDIYAVLQLLNAESPIVGKECHLHDRRKDGLGFDWEIVLPWYRYGSSGGDQSGQYYFQINSALVEELVRERLVETRKVPQWGYTEELKEELVISRDGREKLIIFERDMRAKAESMLIPGVHTDLTGKPRSYGFGRDRWRDGPLYFEFGMPTGGNCKVYPQEDRIELPESEKVEG